MCVAEVPLLKQLQEKYQAQGVVFLGVSLDEDLAALDSLVEEKEIPWPQLCDGRGAEGEIPKLFNVRGSQIFYAIDRQGKVLRKLEGSEGLEALIAQSLQS